MFSLSESARGQAYIISILLASMVVRILIGIVRPELNFEQTALIGVTTVLLIGPPIYQWFFDKPMIQPKKKIQYGVLSAFAASMFVVYIIL